jgi:hypothetical protein
MGSIPASPDARNVPLLLHQERFNEASLFEKSVGNNENIYDVLGSEKTKRKTKNKVLEYKIVEKMKYYITVLHMITRLKIYY